MTDPAASEPAVTVDAAPSAEPAKKRGGRGKAVGGSSAPARPLPPVDEIAPSVEAVLLTADRPLAAIKLAEILKLVSAEPPPPSLALAAADDAAPPAATDASEPAAQALPEPKPVPAPARAAALTLLKQAVDTLNRSYESTGRSFRIESVAGGYRVMTLPKFAESVAAYHGAKARGSLTQAGVETLAIIAYRQPVTRAQLEAIRGVACGEVLRTLIERRLVAIVGRAEELGRPLLYGTTRQFLEVFGLASLKDLPSPEELRGQAAQGGPAGASQSID